jgi:transposase
VPIVYIDESGFAHDMPRTHGYSIKGQRCYGKQDWGAKGRTNAIGALMGKAIIAIGLLSGNVDSAIFTSWVEQILLPALSEKAVIVMDNATFHKGIDMQTLIANAGHSLLYLPPYSPDLNPIEKKWAQAKQIRKTTLCTIDELFTNYLM